MRCVQSFWWEVLRGILRSSQGLVMSCKDGGVMMPQGVLLGQVVMLLVDVRQVLSLHSRMGQILCRWQHLLPFSTHAVRAVPALDQSLMCS